MRRDDFRAMGTTISLLLPENQAGLGIQIVRTLFAEWEQTLSRFLPDSELSQLNQHAGTPTAVSDLLYHVLATALTAAQATQGVYDPAMLDQLVQLGYDRTFDDLTAVHSALEQLHLSGVSPALVNAGGDLAVLGFPPDAEHWQLAVPGREGSWTIPLHHGAVATSGIAHRQWWQGNTLRHHLLDPRTGLSAQSDLWSVTVVADRCEQAEVAAKVAFILGSRQGADFLRRHRIAGLLIHEDGTWETVEPWNRELMEEIII